MRRFIMKTKKTLIAVLAVVLVISAGLIVSCIAPLEEIVKPKAAGTQEYTDIDSNYQIPAGKGVIRVKIPENNLRTILPDLSLTPLSGMKFTFVFTAKGNGANTTTFTKEDWGDAIAAHSLNPDTYDVSITAYDSTGLIEVAGWDSLLVAAYASGIVVTSGSSTPVTANLKAIISTATGTFAYNINVPAAGVCTTTLTVTKYSDKTVTPISLTPNQLNVSTETLVSGYYIVDIIFSKDHCQTVQYTHALHIYPAMTSTLLAAATTAPSALVQNEFVVPFTMDSEALTNSSVFASPVYIGYASTILISPIPSTPGRAFAGWYEDIACTTTPWNSANRIIDGSTPPLYPKYISVTTGSTFTITFTYPDQEKGLTADSYVITRSTFDNDYEIEFVLAAPLSGTWDTVTWVIPGIEPGVITANSNGNILTINNSGNDFGKILADTYFMVSVYATKVGESGVPYSPPPVKITVGN